MHYLFSDQQLPFYLDEFSFRFNRRNSKARGMLFYTPWTPTHTHTKT